ncbi:hypothetical protein [Salinibacter altiplanensis]|uniref:hypothetical protein n=1 Tax=Salinibacter altiplanensis TaxID=1803181 RepID=UPI00131A5377|nr:hypothetical protein [Salinibacter altiplanensis]
MSKNVYVKAEVKWESVTVVVTMAPVAARSAQENDAGEPRPGNERPLGNAFAKGPKGASQYGELSIMGLYVTPKGYIWEKSLYK